MFCVEEGKRSPVLLRKDYTGMSVDFNNKLMLLKSLFRSMNLLKVSSQHSEFALARCYTQLEEECLRPRTLQYEIEISTILTRDQ
jgi:hypothetical protein